MFTFLVLLISWKKYSAMCQGRVIIYLLPISYMPMKYKFSGKMS